MKTATINRSSPNLCQSARRDCGRGHDVSGKAAGWKYRHHPQQEQGHRSLNPSLVGNAQTIWYNMDTMLTNWICMMIWVVCFQTQKKAHVFVVVVTFSHWASSPSHFFMLLYLVEPPSLIFHRMSNAQLQEAPSDSSFTIPSFNQRKLGSNTFVLRTNRILRLEMMKGGTWSNNT